MNHWLPVHHDYGFWVLIGFMVSWLVWVVVSTIVMWKRKGEK
ncbi:MAG: hypothetical protein PHP57_13835 [Sideroxydans sp.]|nr:hypothetical protein [Sideroxydans sp.]